jgi:hypothetical protein
MRQELRAQMGTEGTAKPQRLQGLQLPMLVAEQDRSRERRAQGAEEHRELMEPQTLAAEVVVPEDLTEMGLMAVRALLLSGFKSKI